jgi:hypothetical protein
MEEYIPPMTGSFQWLLSPLTFFITEQGLLIKHYENKLTFQQKYL